MKNVCTEAIHSTQETMVGVSQNLAESLKECKCRQLIEEAGSLKGQADIALKHKWAFFVEFPCHAICVLRISALQISTKHIRTVKR